LPFSAPGYGGGVPNQWPSAARVPHASRQSPLGRLSRAPTMLCTDQQWQRETTMPETDYGARLDGLETRLAYQERTIDELNAALTEQWQLVETLRRRLERVEEQVRSGSYIADPATEKPPPHY